MPKAASDRVNNEADAPVPPSGWVVYPAVPSVGAATARLAARAGYAVCITYLKNKTAADVVVAEIESIGGRCLAFPVDVGIEEQVVGLFEQVDTHFGPIGALVNNAAILEKQSRVENLDANRLQRIFTTNVFGTIICAREAVRRMSTSHGGCGGSIVNLSSVAAKLGAPGEYVDYAASKGAIDTFTVGLAREVATEGIRVNAVRPGVIYTEIHASGGEPERVDRVKSSVPMQRGGQPEEVARTILWLLSDEASYMARR